MAEFVASGRVVDLILLFLLLEAFIVVAWRRRTGRGPRLVDVGGQIASGAFLALAVRSALTDAPWTVTAAWLLASLPAHLWDLSRHRGIAHSNKP